MNFSEALAKFLVSYTVNGYSPMTVKAYRNELTSFGDFLQSQKLEVLAVNPKHVDAYMIEMTARYQGKASSLCMKVRSLKRFYEYLYKNKFVLVNSTQHLREPKIKSRLPRQVLSEQEALKILEQPDLSTLMGLRDRAILEMLYGSGIRAKELTGISVMDVSLETATVTIRRGKGGKGRVVPMTQPGVEYLKAYSLRVRPSLSKMSLMPSMKLWLNLRGGALSYEILVRMVTHYGNLSGVGKRVTPHVFRHSFATSLVRRGVDVRHVQGLLGHACPSTTQIYCRVVGADVKKTHTESHPRVEDAEDLKPQISSWQ